MPVANMSGYARLNYRVTPDGKAYLLEAKSNPQIARDEDFAQSAKHAGLDYEELLQKLLRFGIQRARCALSHEAEPPGESPQAISSDEELGQAPF